MKKISIITINYNNDSGLQKTIESVVNQSFQDFEFVVIDGNSKDHSVEIIKKNPRINTWVSEVDKGIYNAQNKGVEKATGEYLLFLNSGDFITDSFVLEKVSSYLGSADIVYGDLITETITGKRKYESSPQILDTYHFIISTLWHPCAFIHRSVFEKYGNYNEEFKITADYEFFIRTVLRYGVSSRHVKIPIAVFNLSGVSNNPDNNGAQMAERKKSWLLNFSPVVIQTFEDYTRLLRSGEYQIGKKIKSIKTIFGKK